MGTNEIVELIKKYGFLSEEDSFLIYDYPAFENGDLQNFIYSIKSNSVKDRFLVNKMAKFLLKYRDYQSENLNDSTKLKNLTNRTTVNTALVNGVKTGKLNSEDTFILGY